jgi:hypothetical protein
VILKRWLKIKKILITYDDCDAIPTFKIGLEGNGFEVDSYNEPLLALKN